MYLGILIFIKREDLEELKGNRVDEMNYQRIMRRYCF